MSIKELDRALEEIRDIASEWIGETEDRVDEVVCNVIEDIKPELTAIKDYYNYSTVPSGGEKIEDIVLKVVDFIEELPKAIKEG